MAWLGLEGHDRVVEQFRRAIARGRLASTFLFVGPDGVGKRAFALRLAQTLFCPLRPAEAMDPCGQCPVCRQVLAGTHPDLHLVRKPDDKNELPIALLIGNKEKRNREGLCHEIALRPFAGDRRVAILDDADFLNVEGANALLKTLEEPPPGSVIVLLSTALEKQLPTIRSRCQLIRFQPLETEVLAGLLIAQGVANDPDEAQRLAAHSGGSLAQAVALADPELWEFRRGLFERLSAPRLDVNSLITEVLAFVEKVGKDAARRRLRLRQVVGFATELYRQALRDSHDAAVTTGDAALIEGLNRLRAHPPGGEALAQAIECCEASLARIDRFVQMGILVEGWADGLRRAAAPWAWG